MIGDRILLAGWFGVTAGTMAFLSTPPNVSAQMAVAPINKASIISTGSGRVEIERSGDGLFYIDGLIDGTSVRFLIDTGSSALVLAPGDAARIGVAIANGDGGTIQTANGPAAMTWTTVRHVVVAGRVVEKIDAAVPAGGLKVSLLGQELLQKLGPLTIDGDRLVIHANRNSLARAERARRIDQAALESTDPEA